MRLRNLLRLMPCVALLLLVRTPLVSSQEAVPPKLKLPQQWEYTKPLVVPEDREHDRSHAQKDPTIVNYEGIWHLFMTIKVGDRTVMEYCSFKNWEDANGAKRTVLKVSDSKYYCAPQVFYYRPHNLWYLIYQVGIPGQKKMWVAYSTTKNIADPSSWTPAQPMLDGGVNDPRSVGGIDFWIICDEEKAHLFYTSNNGKMWRLWTKLSDFPKGFAHCELALEGPFFEASHTYCLKSDPKSKLGEEGYLTLIEEDGRRYYKAYWARQLEGPWLPIADSESRPFAGATNVRPAAHVAPWSDNISHGELIREGFDERLIVNPGSLVFLFQGMLQTEKANLGYGKFPWKLGILNPVAN